jgi:hypothetical protein
MVKVAHVDVWVKAKFNLPANVLLFGFAGIIQVEKKHEGARYVIDRFIFDG